MAIYARRPWRRAGQVAVDVAVVVWVAVWALLGRLTFHPVLGVATPAREAATAAGQLSAQIGKAAEQAAKVPGVGGQLRQPFDTALGSLAELLGAANRQVASVERLAELLGWLVFAIPVAIVLALWLPRRVAFVVSARAAQRFLDSSADLDLFALRALAHQPMHVLAEISDDPVAAWRGQDATVIQKLADLELRRSGLRMPTTDPAEAAEESKRG
jgi:methyl-accepting chemotaxis protein